MSAGHCPHPRSRRERRPTLTLAPLPSLHLPRHCARRQGWRLPRG